jgi:UDP-glucuronate decarboxylase
LETDLASNPYGFLKLEEEGAMACVCDEIGGLAAICRVFNIAGPYLNKSYVLGDLVGSAILGEPLKVKATKNVFRSFTHVRDIVDVGFAVMLGLTKPEGTAYDTGATEPLEVGELAVRILRALDLIDLPVLRPTVDKCSEDFYVGNGSDFVRMASEVGFEPVSIDDQIRDTAMYLQSLQRFDLSEPHL